MCQSSVYVTGKASSQQQAIRSDIFEESKVIQISDRTEVSAPNPVLFNNAVNNENLKP